MSQNMKLIGVKMSPETHDAILQAASLAGVSVSQFCRERLERAVKIDPTSVMIKDEFKTFCQFLGDLSRNEGHSVQSMIGAISVYFDGETVQS